MEGVARPIVWPRQSELGPLSIAEIDRGSANFMSKPRVKKGSIGRHDRCWTGGFGARRLGTIALEEAFKQSRDRHSEWLSRVFQTGGFRGVLLEQSPQPSPNQWVLRGVGLVPISWQREARHHACLTCQVWRQAASTGIMWGTGEPTQTRWLIRCDVTRIGGSAGDTLTRPCPMSDTNDAREEHKGTWGASKCLPTKGTLATWRGTSLHAQKLSPSLNSCFRTSFPVTY